MRKTFLLGVGAQKAGTTWLYQYLRGHPDCAMGRIKEHAVLYTALSDTRPSTRFVAKADALITLLERLKAQAEHRRPDAAVQAELLDLMDNISSEFDLAYYLMTFERLLAAAPTARLTGDITPEYSLLSGDELARFRQMIEAAGYDLKVVFLMRDPVERAYSALRMTDRNRLGAGLPVPVPAAERFDTQAIEPWVEGRTRYEVILENLDAAFDPGQVHLAFYETFFTEESLSRLLAFLGIAPHPANFGHMANASPDGAALSPDRVAPVRAFYDATYRYCADRFGAAFVSEIWKWT